MVVLYVCLFNPDDGLKGDAKLARERTRTLSLHGILVDILSFRLILWGRERVTWRNNELRNGFDICVELNVVKAVIYIVKNIGVLWNRPVQTWMSYALASIGGKKIAGIFQAYGLIHFYHLRSVGLWTLCSSSTRVFCDLIDSYTLNMQQRIATTKNGYERRLLGFELSRVSKMEREIHAHIREPQQTTVMTVAKCDMSYIGSGETSCAVVPVGINIKKTERKGQLTRRGRIRCVFFGNLDYEPNISACKVIEDLGRELRGSTIENKIEITVAGRNPSRRLRNRLKKVGIKVQSPVDNMESLVREHEIAIIPMISGSGMQSKVLEAIAWDCLLVATEKAAEPVGLEDGIDYIRIYDAKSIRKFLEVYSTSRDNWEEVRNSALSKINTFRWEDTCERLIELYGS